MRKPPGGTCSFSRPYTGLWKGDIAMSILCTAYLPDGIVMSADSRMTVTKTNLMNPQSGKVVYTSSDNAQKLVLLNRVKVGISACGDGAIDDMLVCEYLRKFEREALYDDDGASAVAQRLQQYYGSKIGCTFHVCGYEKDVPHAYRLAGGELKRMNYNEQTGKVLWGMMTSGRQEAITRLLLTQPRPELVWDLMPLKDGIDFCEFLVDLAGKYDRFMGDVPMCGGDTDTLVLAPEGASWYRHKIYKGRE